MYYVDEIRSGNIYGVVDLSDCVKEFIPLSDLVTLGYPDNPNFIDKVALKGFGTKFDKTALRKIMSEVKTPYFDAGMFNNIMIPSLSWLFPNMRIGNVVKLFNYYEQFGFVIIGVEVMINDVKGLLILNTDGFTYKHLLMAGNLKFADKYPCAAGSFYKRTVGVDLEADKLYIVLHNESRIVYIDVVSDSMDIARTVYLNRGAL